MDAERIELSLSMAQRELVELEKDWKAFSSSYESLRLRVIASEEAGPRKPNLRQWSGTCAVMGSLELCLHAIERTIAEHKMIIRKIESGEIRNSDKPALSLVRDQ